MYGVVYLSTDYPGNRMLTIHGICAILRHSFHPERKKYCFWPSSYGLVPHFVIAITTPKDLMSVDVNCTHVAVASLEQDRHPVLYKIRLLILLPNRNIPAFVQV
ncbi:hypothetical protein TWF970_003952 [Orbilia oligospora]|uniref:Uncharacterized protein n=1 Tax=Orbilia oligospora TaxID=2813651 RepID=A0A7C8RGP2_ORBOL|nr:hypothetical protein TWF970_003952 [Orbilia oligospora]